MTTPNVLGVEALYALGHWLLSSARTEDAAIVFRTLVVSAPEDERGWLAMGVCHEKLGQLEVARHIYSSARITVPASCRCQFALARLCRILGDESAPDELEKAEAIAEEQGDDECIAMIQNERLAS